MFKSQKLKHLITLHMYRQHWIQMKHFIFMQHSDLLLYVRLKFFYFVKKVEKWGCPCHMDTFLVYFKVYLF